MDPAREQANPREFIRLLMENERRIYAYIRTLLGNAADAEDVLQKTSVIMWDKFPEFDQGDNFIAWSFKIAFYTSQNFRRKQSRSKVVFSNPLFEVIAEKTVQMVPCSGSATGTASTLHRKTFSARPKTFADEI